MLKTILIAATDPNIIYLLQRYSEESGFRVARCNHDKDLLRQAQVIHPDLIMLQIEPPEAHWRQLVRRLKTDPQVNAIPLVAYSCFDDIIFDKVDEIAGVLQKSVMYSDFISVLKKAGVEACDQTE